MTRFYKFLLGIGFGLLILTGVATAAESLILLRNTWTVGDLFVAPTSGKYASPIHDVATGSVLMSGGVGVAPHYGTYSGFAETTAKVQSYSFTASQMLPTTTAGMTYAQAESSSNKVNYGKLTAADGSTVLHSEFSVMLPANYDASTIAVKLIWTPSANDAVNTYFVGVKAQVLGNTDTIDSSWGTAVTHLLAPGAAGSGKTQITSYAAITPSGTLAGNKLLVVDIYRDPTNGGDLATGSLLLMGCQVLVGENHYSE